MNIREFVLMVLISGSSVYPTHSLAACSGGGAKPAWVDSPESVTDNYFYAAGVSDDTKLALADRISSAKQSALKSLSEIIQVSIKNSLILEQSQRNTKGREFTDSNFSSITQTSTNASLRNVEVIATWEDPRSCAIWLRARVSSKNVELGKQEGVAKTLFGILNEQLALAQNASSPVNDRLSAVYAALDNLPRIPLRLIPEASSADYYKQLLMRIQNELLLTQSALDQARNVLTESSKLINEASKQTDEVTKSKQLAAALNNYKNLLAKHSNGLSPLFAPGDIFFKLGEVEETRRNTCGAKNYYLQSADSKHLDDNQSTARTRGNALVCSTEDMEKALWRQYFEGRPTTIVCYYSSNAEQGAWNKACDGINNIIRPLGADITIRTQKISPAQLKEIQRGEIPNSLSEKGKVFLGIFASGKMISRIDKESPGRNREYQFEGAMATFLSDDGKTIFSDRFQGKTGWNPVSQQMVMDVLAINVVKRWKDKFSRFLRKEPE